MTEEDKYLEIGRKKIEEKLGWTPISQWRDAEFLELSEKIYDVTSVQLSTTTLKRFFGKVKYDSLPSSSTLNALSGFLGYENWMAFKTDQSLNKTTEKHKKNFNSFIRSPRFRRTAVFAVMSGVLLLSITAFVFLSSPSAAIDLKNIVFTSCPLAEGLPNSVVFKTDLNGIKSDNIYIQQSWDSTRTVKLKPGQTEATGIYYVPGYFRAKLIVDKKIIKEHDLFIKSNGWMATIEHDLIPDYIKNDELVKNGVLTIPPAALEKIRNLGKQSWLVYHLVQPFNNLQSDNFSLETSFQNTYGEGQAICKTAKLFVLCTNGAFIIPFTIPGCASDINLKISEKTWEGKSNDLSVFGTDPSLKLDVRLEVKNRQAFIFLDNHLLRSEKYDADAGNIVGLRYSFLGAGVIDYVTLKNGAGETVYSDNF